MKPTKSSRWLSALGVFVASLLFAGAGASTTLAQEGIKVFITTDSFTGARAGVRVEIEVEPRDRSSSAFDLAAGQRVEISPGGVTGPSTPAGQGPTVKTKKPVYAPGERIEVDYSNSTGHIWDWIALARPNEGNQTSIGLDLGGRWSSRIGDARTGVKAFDGLPEGNYEARYISWDGGNNRATARSTFSVGNAPPPPPPPTPGGTPIPTETPVPTGTPPVIANSSDLSGFWADDTGNGAIYRIRQLGNKLYWTVDGTSKGEYVNVFHGVITGNMIDGEWLDMPGSPLRPALVAATLGLRIESNDRLVKVRSGNFYPAQVWTRQGGPAGQKPVGETKCAPGNPEKTVTIEVPANRAWTPTGVSLNPCVEVRVEASGAIEAAVGSDRGAFYRGVPPAGRGQFHSDKPYQSVFALSMVGRIGDGPVLPIGTFARWYAGPPYGSGELFLGINDDGLSDNSGAWKARITTFGAAAAGTPGPTGGDPGGGPTAGGGSCRPVGTWTFEDTGSPPFTGTITFTPDALPNTIAAKVIASNAGEGFWEVGPRTSTGEASYRLVLGPSESRSQYTVGIMDGQRLSAFKLGGVGPQRWFAKDCRVGGANAVTGLVQKIIPPIEKPKVEEIPDDLIGPAKNTGPIKKPETGKPAQLVVEEIPNDLVAGKPKKPVNKNDPVVIEEIPDDLVIPKEKLGGIVKPQTGKPNQPKVSGPRWTLVSVEVNPENPPRGGGITWEYNKQSTSAHYVVYNGDKADFQWTRPPQEVDSSGFTVSVAVLARPAPNSRVASIIGVSGTGLLSDTPLDQQSVPVNTDKGVPSGRREVTFRPAPGASQIEVRVSMQWAVSFTYKYRRAE